MSEPEKMIVFSWAFAFAIMAYVIVKKRLNKKDE